MAKAKRTTKADLIAALKWIAVAEQCYGSQGPAVVLAEVKRSMRSPASGAAWRRRCDAASFLQTSRRCPVVSPVDIRSESERATDKLLDGIPVDARVVLFVGKVGALSAAQQYAVRFIVGPVRAPHHTVSSAGFLSELALAAGGSLILDEVGEFRRDALRYLGAIWSRMSPRVRPVLCLVVREWPDPVESIAEKLDALLPKVDFTLEVSRG